MDFELSEAQEMLRDSVRRFLADNAPIATAVRPLLDDPRGLDAKLWRGLGELGLHGLLVPEACGGSGLGMIEMGVACEEIGRALLPGPFAASALGAVSALDLAGSDDDRTSLLPALARGERIGAVALDENGHADQANVATVARGSAAAWRLTGVKQPVADGFGADLWVVSARDEASDAVGLFVIEPGSGVSIEPIASIDGTRKLAVLGLEDAPARRLGGDRDAAAALAAIRDRVVIGQVADGLGAAQRVFELALAYAREREQFGRPIGSFQAIQHMLVDMLQDLELARAGLYYALWAADAASAPRAGADERTERHRAATMAKAFTSRAFPAIGADAIQIHGGVGFTWELDVHLYYKRLLTLAHTGGDERAHLEELARLALDS